MEQQALKTTSTVKVSKSAYTRTRTTYAWIFLAPTLAVIAFIALYPLAQTFYQSFTDQTLGSADPVNFVGFNNYTKLFADTEFFNTIGVTVFFTIVTVIFEFIFGMIVALVINSNFKGRGIMRAAMLIPWAIPTVVSTQMWKWMYNDIYGVINDLLVNKLHVMSKNVAFIADNTTSLPAIAAVDIWKTTPFVSLLILAGLQLIPTDIYEAARVDGATKVQQYFAITLPLLRASILVALIFRTLDALRVFDAFFVMFGNRPGVETMATYAQQQLVNFSDVGYGSAVCVAIFFIITIFVVLYVVFFKIEEEPA